MSNKMDNYNDKQLEELISKSITKKMKSLEQEVDIEKSWERFQKKLKQRERKRNFTNSKIAKYLLVACSIILVVALFKIDGVTAYKNDFFQMIFISEDGDQILAETSSQKIDEGVYADLSFQKAQELTVFHLKYPQYLPSGIGETPTIEVNVIVYPLALTTLTFQEEKQGGKQLIIEQENLGDNTSRNTYIPDNKNIQELIIKDNKVTLITGENSASALWSENSIRYTLFTSGISDNDIISIIKNLK